MQDSAHEPRPSAGQPSGSSKPLAVPATLLCSLLGLHPPSASSATSPVSARLFPARELCGPARACILPGRELGPAGFASLGPPGPGAGSAPRASGAHPGVSAAQSRLGARGQPWGSGSALGRGPPGRAGWGEGLLLRNRCPLSGRDG